MEKPKDKKNTIQVILLGVAIALVVINCAFLILFTSQAKSIALLKNEVGMLESARTASDTSAIAEEYEGTLETLEDVFPDEETMPTFIQELETNIRAVSGEYSIKFNSLTPVPEQDKLFLLLTIHIKTDFSKLNVFLKELEEMPYMTHVTVITGKTSGGFTGESDYNIGLKIYVKNPFTAG
jgi:hypothetical protein